MNVLLPTTLVGSYPQPDWLIDRPSLLKQMPPRVRASETQVEFSGTTIRELSIEGRMTLCNLAIEMGARAGRRIRRERKARREGQRSGGGEYLESHA